ncbi:sulfate permease [Aureibaculum sp. 2210JD6-5]|uniref:SulP family inorganic anion transporter n=1 Tax=Aureibaculum sp. 2210JD6-5 TaxID=3103957 RepID=UPI002AACCFEC|nr:sulfate permease [Aureibaculum sp. 2210JD6-5]MDY7396221.1 sulfate permease [Aureibaculum sp. 2210JD6-5]
MNKIFPILDWLPNYKTSLLRGDIFAGLTIGIILIPQGIAYAIIAGLPPIYGLYTALIPQLIYTIFGTSKWMSTGPTALDSLILASSISTLAIVGVENYIAIVFATTLLTGIFQLILGAFKLGFIMNFVSKPVLTGFITAAAVIIALSQFRDLFGIDAPRSNQIQYILSGLFDNIGTLHWHSLLIGVLAIFLIYGLHKINKQLPGQLIAIILGIIIMKVSYNYLEDVEIVKSIPKGLPSFAIPEMNYDLFLKLMPIALTLSFTGFLQATSISKSLEDVNSKLDTNKELIALGASNFIGSFFSAYVSTGSFSRSAVNKEAGANTPLANVFAALFILITLLFLTPLFYYLPKPVLAAIIITAVIKLIKVYEIKFLWNTNKKDFIMMLITFLVTLTFGIKEGIIVGVLVSIFVVIFQSSKPHMAVLGKVPGTPYFYRNIDRFDDVTIDDDILIIRFDAQLYFANVNYFREKLERLVNLKGDVLKLIVIDAAVIHNIDSTGIAMLNDIVSKYHKRGIKIYFTDVKGPVRDYLTKSKLIDKIGVENCFMHIQDAVEFYKTGTSSSTFSKYIKQSN